MSAPPITGVRLCPECRAENSPGAKACWLCHAPLSANTEVVMAELVREPGPSPLTEKFFLALTLACLILLVLVGIGLAQDDPGLLIPYLIAITPAILATVSHSLVKASRGERVTAMQVFLTFLISASVTVLIVVVTFVAAVVALFVYCIYVFSNGFQ